MGREIIIEAKKVEKNYIPTMYVAEIQLQVI